MTVAPFATTVNMAAAPYSQCDPRGRCVRHPDVQLSRKKTLGGWKTLLQNCPLCAVELMREGTAAVSADAYCGEVGAKEPRRTSHRDAASVHSNHSKHSHSRPQRGHRSRPHRDDASVEQSVRSAPSTVHRARHPAGHGRQGHHGHSPRQGYPEGPHAYPTKSHHTSSEEPSGDSSCDTTVEMGSSSSSELSRSESSLSHSGRGSVHSRGSQASQGRRMQLPQVGHHDAPQDQEEEFVCGMPFDGMYYTGQIHAQTRLPHGLGTLRSDCGGRMLEGEWEYGRLVNGTHQEHTEEEYDYQDTQGEYADEGHCRPCRGPPRNQGRCEDDALCRNFRECNSIAETDDGSVSSAEWSGSNVSSLSSYSARESKFALPSGGRSSGRAHPRSPGARASQRKAREFERYIERCDEEGDYYCEEEGLECSQGSGYSEGSDDRVRRVRFREDPRDP